MSLTYAPKQEQWHEVPPRRTDIDYETGEVLGALGTLTDEDLVRKLQNVRALISGFSAERVTLESEVRRRCEERKASEIAGHEAFVRLEKSSDKAIVRREWLVELREQGTITPGEMEALLPANVSIGVRGWDMLVRRGLKPEENGERTPQPDRITIKIRK